MNGMITIDFSRKSVCMGDDVNCGKYTVSLPKDAVLGDLIRAVLKGGSGNDRPIPWTGAGSEWIIKSNRGPLARLLADDSGLWRVEYAVWDEKTPLRSLGIQWIYGDRE